jgi:hypothetical protein
VINGAHAIIFTRDPVGVRAFFRDVLELPWVDAGDGWLLFALPPTELAAHPAERGEERHELYLMCDDLHLTVERLERKGVGLSVGALDLSAPRIIGGAFMAIRASS